MENDLSENIFRQKLFYVKLNGALINFDGNGHTTTDGDKTQKEKQKMELTQKIYGHPHLFRWVVVLPPPNIYIIESGSAATLCISILFFRNLYQ
jgi:hypothetical protein